MAIYLGDAGHIELQRRSINENYVVSLDQADVDTNYRRFSFEGVSQEIFLITGDRIRFERQDGLPLELVKGITDQTGVTKFVHIDSIGGIRLYESFTEAVDGKKSNSLELVEPSTNQDIEVIIEEIEWRCLAQVQDYTITTTRETIDLTNLGDEYRRNYASGLVNGQGQCSCIWDYDGDEDEYANYLAKLILRVQLGAAFNGKFYIKKANSPALDQDCSSRNEQTSLWWEALCIVTNVSMSFAPGQIVVANIDFVTSDVFTLKAGILPSYLRQEDLGLVLEEESGRGIILDADI